MADDSPEAKSSGGGGKALRNATIVVALLVVLTPLRALTLPIAIVLTLVGIAYILRATFRYNRILGRGLFGLVATALCAYVALISRAELQHQRLLTQLESYDVSVRRNFFPIPYVHQLSIEGGVSDADFGLILGLDGLDRISDLYLDNEVLTDASLQIASTMPNLKYVFIDCDKITDDAILRFESRFPKCRVIPYQRNLHGPPTVFLSEPTG